MHFKIILNFEEFYPVSWSCLRTTSQYFTSGQHRKLMGVKTKNKKTKQNKKQENQLILRLKYRKASVANVD